MISNWKDFLNESKSNLCGSKMCNECPFSKNSLPGWLADYTPDEVIEFVTNEGLFPCHKMVKGDDLDQDEVEEKIESGEMKLCRGFVESIIKSAKSPRYNQTLIEAMKEVRAEGTSPESMAIWDFKKHHSKK